MNSEIWSELCSEFCVHLKEMKKAVSSFGIFGVVIVLLSIVAERYPHTFKTGLDGLTAHLFKEFFSVNLFGLFVVVAALAVTFKLLFQSNQTVHSIAERATTALRDFVVSLFGFSCGFDIAALILSIFGLVEGAGLAVINTGSLLLLLLLYSVPISAAKNLKGKQSRAFGGAVMLAAVAVLLWFGMTKGTFEGSGIPDKKAPNAPLVLPSKDNGITT